MGGQGKPKVDHRPFRNIVQVVLSHEDDDAITRDQAMHVLPAFSKEAKVELVLPPLKTFMSSACTRSYSITCAEILFDVSARRFGQNRVFLPLFGGTVPPSSGLLDYVYTKTVKCVCPSSF
jgi:hypothetical protein